MSTFEYQALDGKGRTRKGVLEGNTPRYIRHRLREDGLIPLSVEEIARKSRRAPRRRSFAAGTGEVAVLTRQLATLLRAGLTLEETLLTVARQTGKPRIRQTLLGVRSSVLEGHSLAEAIDRYPDAFPSVYGSTIAAGEQSGHLDAVLERLANYSEKRQEMRQQIGLALLYPGLLTAVAVLIVAGMLGYVVPEVMQVFENIGQELPWLTRTLINTSDFVRDWGLLLVILASLSVPVLRRLLRVETFRYALHRTLLRLPLASRLVRELNTARFAGTLGILLSSSVPVLEALRISAGVVMNLPMRRAVEQAAKKVGEGSSLNSALEGASLFSPVTVQLISTGEKSGNLAIMLQRASDVQNAEVERLVTVLMRLFEPVLILVMGGLVLTIVLAILLPIFDLNQLIQ